MGARIVTLALSALIVEGARIAKRRRSNSSQDCFSKYDGQPLLSLTPCTAAELDDMLTYLQDCTVLTEDFHLPATGGCADELAVCKVDRAAQLEEKFGEHARIVKPDAGGYYRDMSGPAESYVEAYGARALSDDFYSKWRDLDARMARIEAAVAASRGAARIETAGKSLEGRPIKIVRFTGAGYKPGKPKVVLTFNVHAREWIAGMSGVYAVEKLVMKLEKEPSYLAGVEVVMMPLANPDGFVYSTTGNRFHRKNMNKEVPVCTGVDINRNFAAKWNTGGSSSIPCVDNYHGKAAMSEPETKVIAAVLEESKMTVLIDIHAFSQLVLSSWGYTREDHPRKAEFSALGKKMQAAIEARHGQKYTEGPIAQVLYKASGSMSDYATMLGALGYCFELRPKGRHWSFAGFAPPTKMILPTAEECFDGIVASIDHARKS